MISACVGFDVDFHCFFTCLGSKSVVFLMVFSRRYTRALASMFASPATGDCASYPIKTNGKSTFSGFGISVPFYKILLAWTVLRGNCI